MIYVILHTVSHHVYLSPISRYASPSTNSCTTGLQIWTQVQSSCFCCALNKLSVLFAIRIEMLSIWYIRIFLFFKYLHVLNVTFQICTTGDLIIDVMYRTPSLILATAGNIYIKYNIHIIRILYPIYIFYRHFELSFPGVKILNMGCFFSLQ